MLALLVYRVCLLVFFEWGMRCVLGRISTDLTILTLPIKSHAIRHMMEDTIFTKLLLSYVDSLCSKRSMSSPKQFTEESDLQ